MLVASAWASGPHEKILWNFGNGTDGAVPTADLISDSQGNLYGTTSLGGIHLNKCGGSGCGTVFQLSPRQGGGWTETILHSFGNGADGQMPMGTLVADQQGNFYGTTTSGGSHNNCSGSGCGTVFELSPRQGGGWTETILHSFGGSTDGKEPVGNLVVDTNGNLYGTTAFGGIHPCSGGDGCGTVFELSPRQGGGWIETILHSFGQTGDGENPMAGLVIDGQGNLYGTTYNGGIHQLGTVFELSPNQSGGFTEVVVHSFGRGSDGTNPDANLIIDSNGNLYGTTQYGGIHSQGTAFEMSPRQGGGFSETLLHSFGNLVSNDGQNPIAPLAMDTDGNFYGTTFQGGIYFAGTAFELSPNGSGGWNEVMLRNFGNGIDGAYPAAGVLLDSAGHVYGTTELGGSSPSLDGVVFEITP